MTNEDQTPVAGAAAPLPAAQPKTPEQPNLGHATQKLMVVVASLASLGLIVCLIGHYGSVAVDLTRTKDFSTALNNAVQVLAILVGGVVAYFKFGIARTFQQSLIATVSGKLVLIDGKTYLIADIQAKNVGATKIAFDLPNSLLKIAKYAGAPPKDTFEVHTQEFTQVRALHEDDHIIEPNEATSQTLLIAVPGLIELGLRLDVEIKSRSERNWWVRSGFTWRASGIVEPIANASSDDSDPNTWHI